MQTLIDSILDTIPEKYLVYTKELSKDLFSKSELAELENIITTMTNKNKEIKSMELKKNMDIINISFNPSDTLKKLNSLEIIDIADKPLTRDSTVKIINQEIRNNLDKSIKGKDIVTEITLEKIIKSLDISHDKFIELCVICGCDYCDNIPKIGNVKALKIIKEYEV
jgi:hypothetical protein